MTQRLQNLKKSAKAAVHGHQYQKLVSYMLIKRLIKNYQVSKVQIVKCPR